MERLTIRDEDGDLALNCNECSNDGSLNCDIENCCLTAICRLAAYEDTSLSPEQVRCMRDAFMGKCIAEISEFDGISIARLKELVEADRGGRCKILPVKLGNAVYNRKGEEHKISHA